MFKTAYVLRFRNGNEFKQNSREFHAWCDSKQYRVGADFKTRLAQLREYTKMDIVDWTLEDVFDT